MKMRHKTAPRNSDIPHPLQFAAVGISHRAFGGFQPTSSEKFPFISFHFSNNSYETYKLQPKHLFLGSMPLKEAQALLTVSTNALGELVQETCSSHYYASRFKDFGSLCG